MLDRWFRLARIFSAGALLTATVGLIAVASLAGAAELVVTNTNDAGPGSLRQAVADAATNPGDDVVVIPAGLGPFNLLSTINYADGDGLLTVLGNGNTVAVAGNFTVFNSSTSSMVLDDLVLSSRNGANSASGSLTVRNSVITSNDGDGINTASGPILVQDTVIMGTNGGDGINSAVGNVTAERVTIVAENDGINTSSGSIAVADSAIIGSGAQTREGVGSSSGDITVVNSTITGWLNAGIETDVSASVINSTITGNPGDGVRAQEARFVYATVVDNGEPGTGGQNIDIVNVETFASVFGGGGDACEVSSITSHGYNYSADDTCGLNGAGDVDDGGDPGLGPLGDNGGATQTMLPESASPLVDGVPIEGCQANGATGITSDQRGLSRPSGEGCDVGAVEVQVGSVPPGPTPTTDAATGGPGTRAVTPRFTG
jgi:hypothetical protein